MPPKQNPRTRSRAGSHSLNKSIDRKTDKNTDSNDIWVCEACKKEFTQETDKVIQCEYCDKYYCSKCLGLTNEQYDVFMNPSLHWFCHTCEDKVIKNIRTDREVETRCTEFLQAMENRVRQLETEMSKKVDTDQVKKIIKETIKESGNSDQIEIEEIRTELNKQVSDLKDSTNREKNMIIHGVKEVDDKNSTVRKERDTSFVNNLAQFIEADDSCILNVTRIGKRKETTSSETERSNETSKPRPIKVVWSETAPKRSFMKNLVHLRKVDEHSPFYGVSVTHDMSQDERDENKRLYLEAKAKNEKEKSGKFKFLVRGPPWARRIIRVPVR